MQSKCFYAIDTRAFCKNKVKAIEYSLVGLNTFNTNRYIFSFAGALTKSRLGFYSLQATVMDVGGETDKGNYGTYILLIISLTVAIGWLVMYYIRVAGNNSLHREVSS